MYDQGNIDQEFILKEINEKRKYFIKEIKENELISKKRKKICKILNCTEHLFILTSTVTGCISIFALASLVGIPVGIASSTTTIKNCLITAGIKKYGSIIERKEKKKHDKIVLN